MHLFDLRSSGRYRLQSEPRTSSQANVSQKKVAKLLSAARRLMSSLLESDRFEIGFCNSAVSSRAFRSFDFNEFRPGVILADYCSLRKSGLTAHRLVRTVSAHSVRIG